MCRIEGTDCSTICAVVDFPVPGVPTMRMFGSFLCDAIRCVAGSIWGAHPRRLKTED